MNTKEKMTIKSRLLLIFIILSAVACGNKTTVKYDNASVGAELVLTTFQGANESAWKKDAAGTIHTNSRTVDFTGTCSRTIKSVIIKIDGSTSATPVCSATGNFSWSNSFGTDVAVVLSFVPVLLGDGLPSTNGTITKNLRVDTVAPAAPVITTNGGANMVITVANVTINGTTSSDTFSLTTTDNGTLSFTAVSQTFQLDSTLTSGQTKILSFTALDVAGNGSTADTIQVAYESSFTLQISDTSGSGLAAPITNSGVRLVSVSTSPFLTAAPVIFSAPDGHKHYIGVTNVSANNQ
ncbi:MAG: hypothetical protein SGJ18_10670 [Pseudomonadota bacterium]|nr:hypothetical protein [Pseudomonadota bacterium]